MFAMLVCIGERSVVAVGARHLLLADGLLYTMRGAGALVVITALVVVTAATGAVVLEGWTRPDVRERTGLARPAVRRWVLLALVATGTAFATCAGFNWSRVAVHL